MHMVVVEYQYDLETDSVFVNVSQPFFQQILSHPRVLVYVAGTAKVSEVHVLYFRVLKVFDTPQWNLAGPVCVPEIVILCLSFSALTFHMVC